MEIEAAPGTRLILNGIPARLCADCGEAFTDLDTVQQLESVVDLFRIEGLGTVTRQWNDVTGR